MQHLREVPEDIADAASVWNRAGVKTEAAGLTLIAGLSLSACGDFVSADGGETDEGSTSTGLMTTTTRDPGTDSASSTTEEPSSTTTGETADDASTSAADVTSTGLDTDTETDSVGPVCGDGVVEGDEACDDRGESTRCNEDCTLGECGDGVVNETAGEACDGAGESETCNADCSEAACGDAQINAAAGETCDEGEETDTCDEDCTAVECGDGVTNEAAGEMCDDGGESKTCDADCSTAECGDGTINGAAGEECEGGPGCADTCTISCPVFSAEMFDPAVSFGLGDLSSTAVSIAWDGTSYWAVSGGSLVGPRAVQYAEDGTQAASFEPGVDFRSIFAQGDGTAPLYARGFDDDDVLTMDGPGMFSVETTLAVSDPLLDDASAVVWDDEGGVFVALSQGAVLRWGDDGSFAGGVTLSGYGTEPGELDFPSTRSLAFGEGCYLTYADGVLSSWDPQGQRVDSATLEVAATFESEISLSFANGMVFLADGTDWRGFDVF